MDQKCFGSNLAMKTDIQKAYDMMRWTFILSILCQFVFSAIFCDWILIIFQFARISFFINGHTKSYFSYSRGIRQGASFSLVSFGIPDDYLSRVLTNFVDRDLLSLMFTT